MLLTVDENLKPLSVPVRVGQAVDVVGQAGRPKTITGFQTHSTPVLLAAGDRAELATEKYGIVLYYSCWCFCSLNHSCLMFSLFDRLETNDCSYTGIFPFRQSSKGLWFWKKIRSTGKSRYTDTDIRFAVRLNMDASRFQEGSILVGVRWMHIFKILCDERRTANTVDDIYSIACCFCNF